MLGRNLKKIFILVQLVLYGSFITLDILGRSIGFSNRIKFTVVALCFLYAINGKKRYSKQQIYLCCALAFTAVSDIIILFSDFYVYGVLTFIIAQLLYGMRITALYNREILASTHTSPLKDLGLRFVFQAVICALISTLIWILDIYIDALLVSSIFYFICICSNLERSLRLSRCFKDKRDIRCFAIGFVLFLLCDINVGLFNLSEFMPLGEGYTIIYTLSSILMWTFYAPSQVLIALSGDETCKISQ